MNNFKNNMIENNLAPAFAAEDLNAENMIKIKVLNHLNKIVIIEVSDEVYNEIEIIIISKYATKLEHLELLNALSIPLSKLVNDFYLITEDIVNAAVNKILKK